MDGPWSQYAPATSSAPPPVATGPWTQYAPQKADASPAPAAPDMSAQSEFPTYAAPAPDGSAPGNAAVERIGKAAADAYDATPSVLGPDAEKAINETGTGVEQSIGQYITNPALKVVGGAIGAGNAAMAALAQSAMEVFGEKGGRDVLALLSSIPVAESSTAASMRAAGPEAQAAVTASPTPKMHGEAFAPDVSQLDSRNAIQALIQHDINENPVIPSRAPDFGSANQGAEAVAAIGAAPDIDTAIAAASKAAQSPVERPMAQWMQPISRDVAPSIEQAEAPAGSSGLAQTAPTIDDAFISDTAAPQSMSDYLEANRPAQAPIVQPEALTAAIEARNVPATSQAAKQIASAYYQKADDVGGVLTPEFANRFVDEAEQIAPQTNEGRMILGNSPVTNLIDRIQNLRDQPISLQGAQEIDEGLGNLISNEFGPVGLSKEGKNLLDLQTTFRDMIMHAGPEDIEGGTEGFDALSQARVAWSQAMKMGDLERILDRAELTDNPATSIKSGIRVLLSNPARARGYTPAEISALRSAADRGVLGGVLHVFGGRLVPYAAAATVGGPIGAGVGAGIGYLGSTMLRNAASALQTRRIGNAMSVLGEGVPAPPAP